jgi:predicted helicase
MSLALKPTHATVKAYYDTLGQFGQLHIDHEMAVRSAFQDLLAKSGRKAKPPLTLVPEYRIERARGSSVIVDGALVDLYHLPHGYWEAKDEKDDLAKEVQLKLDKGYPRDNIIFQAPERAILYQGGARMLDENISSPESLVQVVNQFFDYKAPHIQEWEQAVGDFSERIPELAAAVKKTIDDERRLNPAFVRSFNDFYALCRQAINPNLSEEAVERMLVQHLLTERIFRKIFANPDFTRRNVVAAEIEKVINELTKRAFNRDEFLGNLDRFYKAIEQSAENATSFSEKQAFLNKVYERFFQGYSPKEADTHGIVYTPQPIVNFMVRSVEEILQKEFGRSLGDKGVHILDPFVGTGNFIVRIMQEIKATDLQYKYENELHCNEVMLLPYYIASMNIEHAYFDRTDEYKAFPGICLVDTFELAESKQVPMFTERNSERVERQKQQQIFVIVGNPPYNAWQLDENDNNKNRKYPAITKRVADTYASAGRATLMTSLSDPYVKAFRWASDRIGQEGVVAFVSNNSFIDQVAFDGVRKCLAEEFDSIYILDLGGNVRKNPKLSGTTHNVFGIQVGVSVNLFVKNRRAKESARGIFHSNLEIAWRKEQKYTFLEQVATRENVHWTKLHPDPRNTWLRSGLHSEYDAFLELGSKKEGRSQIFTLYSHGINTQRDTDVYNFSDSELQKSVQTLAEAYNSEADRWVRKGRPKDLDAFVDYKKLKWSRNLKRHLRNLDRLEPNPDLRVTSLYRPFTTAYVFYGDVAVDELGKMQSIFPPAVGAKNLCVCVTSVGSEKPFFTLASACIPNYHLTGAGSGTQCFPFYSYAEDGTHRRENISDWALEQFRAHYHDPSITKWDIFHYIYAVLHHPEYRERYAANLRRELPRIPFASSVTPSSLSSRAESRDLLSANTQHRRREEFSPRNAADRARTPQRPYEKLSADGKERVLSGVKAMQDAGELHYVSQDDARVFRALAKAGQRLAEIHVHYEQQPEYPVTKTEKAGEKLDYRVTKMKLSKDKTSLLYNQFLILSDIPKEAYEYRLGNRSALEWVIDQYQVSTDKRSGITNDPNRPDDLPYILRLIGQVVTVSLETVNIVRSLPSLGLEGA